MPRGAFQDEGTVSAKALWWVCVIDMFEKNEVKGASPAGVGLFRSPTGEAFLEPKF